MRNILQNYPQPSTPRYLESNYETKEEKDFFESWTLGGNLCLKREEWNILFDESGYKGDYLFIDSNYLNLKLKK